MMQNNKEQKIEYGDALWSKDHFTEPQWQEQEYALQHTESENLFS